MAEKALPASIKAAVDKIMAAMESAKAKRDWTPKQHAIMLDLVIREAYGIKPPPQIGKDSTKDQIAAHAAFRKRSDALRADLQDGRVMYCSNMRKLVLGPDAKDEPIDVDIE